MAMERVQESTGYELCPADPDLPSSIRVDVVRSEADAAEVARLRQAACAGADWFDTEGDARRDAAGVVWLLRRLGKPAASARALPYASGIGFFTEIGAPLHLLPLDESWVEVGRLVSDPSAGFMTAQLLISECARWLLEHTDYRRGYAMCDPNMVPYYRRFGMQVSEERHHVSVRGKSMYSHLLYCDLDQIGAKCSDQGLASGADLIVD